MKRRALFGKIAAAAAAVSLAPAGKIAEAGAVNAAPAPGPDDAMAAVYERGWKAGEVFGRADMSYAQQGSLTVTSNATLSEGIVMGPTGGFDSRPEIRFGPPTFEAMQADCAARGCSLHTVETLSGGYLIIHGHLDVPAPWPAFGPNGVHYGPLSPIGLAAVDAWRRRQHGEDG